MSPMYARAADVSLAADESRTPPQPATNGPGEKRAYAPSLITASATNIAPGTST
jgi:hypothetical protein